MSKEMFTRTICCGNHTVIRSRNDAMVSLCTIICYKSKQYSKRYESLTRKTKIFTQNRYDE